MGSDLDKVMRAETPWLNPGGFLRRERVRKTHTCTCVHRFRHTHAHVCTGSDTHIHVCTDSDTHMRVCTGSEHTYAHVCIGSDTHTSVCVCVYTQVPCLLTRDALCFLSTLSARMASRGTALDLRIEMWGKTHLFVIK